MSNESVEPACIQLFKDKVLKEYLPKILDSIEKIPAARSACKALLSLLAIIRTPWYIQRIRKEMPEISETDMQKLCSSPFFTTWMTVLCPSADHLYGSFMLGCLPLCYHSIRVILEAMTISYYVEYTNYLEHEDPISRLVKFNEELRQKSLSKFLKEDFSKVIGEEIGERAARLWFKISNDFMHFGGFVRKLHSWNNSEGESPPPSWAIGAFIPYDTSDEDQLKELEKYLTELQKVYDNILERWIKECAPRYFI